MKGSHWKTRKRKLKKATKEEGVIRDAVSSHAAEKSNAASGGDFVIFGQSAERPIASTTKRGEGDVEQTQETCTALSPAHSSRPGILSNESTSPPGAKEVGLEYADFSSHLKTPEVSSPRTRSSSQTRSQSSHVSQPRQLRKRSAKEKTQTVRRKNNVPLVKNRCGRQRKIKTGATTSQSSKRSRPRFELEMPDVAEQDEFSLSSMELSNHEEQGASLPLQEDKQSDEEEEELPSFLMHVEKKPQPITEGMFVWHKFRNYPFWPALVKSVNRRQKKASILFIDDLVIHKRGFIVALKALKPFDCEEANELVFKAKEKFDAAIEWSLELVEDYRIRIACQSFSGSFVDYFAHDMSYPVRRKYPQATAQRLTIVNDEITEVPCDDHKEDSVSEQRQDASRRSKRLLPDRSHAAHNRANEKLVHFIVKQRMVEERLLAVIRRQQQSRWLRAFLSANRTRVVNIYLEDDQQLDQVYCYLNELYSTAVATTPCLTEVMERVPFVLDVLLPEAIIHAIAGVDNVSLQKAEEKYLEGRCISNRERQEFDLMIERQMRNKSVSKRCTLVPDVT